MMLDQLKELIPLMESVADGTFWLIIAYLSVIVFKMLLIVATILLLVHWAIRAILQLNGMEGVKANNWNMYQWDDKDRSLDALFSREVFQDLLKSIADENGRVGNYEITEAIKKLKK